MVTLTDALWILRPDAVLGVDYVLMDTGDGPYIAAWRLLDPPPTAEALAAVTQEQVDVARLGKSMVAAVEAVQQPNLLDLTTASINLVLQVMGTRVNDAFRAMGQPPPLLQLDVLNDVRTLVGLPPLP